MMPDACSPRRSLGFIFFDATAQEDAQSQHRYQARLREQLVREGKLSSAESFFFDSAAGGEDGEDDAGEGAAQADADAGEGAAAGGGGAAAAAAAAGGTAASAATIIPTPSTTRGEGQSQ